MKRIYLLLINTLLISAAFSQPLTTSITGLSFLCQGNCTNLTASASGGTAPYTFSWDNGVPNGPGPHSVCPAADTDYTVTVTDSDGTVVSETISIFVDEMTLTISHTDASCNGLCDGTATVIPNGGTAPYTFIWNTTPPQTTQTATGLCAGIYTTTVANNNGCDASISVTINEPPPIILTTTFTPSNCGSANGSATVDATGGTPGYTYLWNDPLAQTTPSAINLSAGSYNVTVTDTNGCEYTEIVTVTFATACDVKVNVPNQTICVGECVDVIALILGGKAPFTFIWDAAVTGATTSGPHNVCPSVTTTYAIAVEDDDGNTHDSTFTITVNPRPIVDAGNDESICIGQSTTITATGAVTYDWDNGLGAGASHTVNPVATTTYTVTGTDTDGCVNTDDVTVIVNPLPAPPIITQTGNTLSVSLAAGQTVQWYFDGTPVSGGNTATITMIGDGDYRAVLADENGCESYSEGNYTILSTSLLTNYLGNMTHKIYPMPNTGLFTLEMGNVTTPVNVRLIDVLGKEIATYRSSGVSNELTLRFDLTERATGIYFLILEGGQHHITEKVVVNR